MQKFIDTFTVLAEVGWVQLILTSTNERFAHIHTHARTHVTNSGLPVAEKPVRLMGDDESRCVKDALSAFYLDVILSFLHHLAPMATNYEAHVAYTSFTYFVSYRLNRVAKPVLTLALPRLGSRACVPRYIIVVAKH